MKPVTILIGLILVACGGAPFSGSGEQLDEPHGSGGSAGSAGEAGAGLVAGSAGIGLAGATSNGGGTGQAGTATAGQAGSAAGQAGAAGQDGTAGTANCSPLSCRNPTDGSVYCGTLTNLCGERLDCGTDCQGAGTCGTSSDPHLCTGTCKAPRCVDQHGQFTCGIQRNACGDELNCGLVDTCDGTMMKPDGTRAALYPNGRCGQIPDGCGGFITCGTECPAGTYCDANGVCQ